MPTKVVVIGAGIAGVSVAHELTVKHGHPDVTLVDPLPPLTLTSDKSTECYRNWWPTESMVGLMNRSIDLLEEMAIASNNVFGLSRRGYLYVTSEPTQLEAWEVEANRISRLGAGPVRVHPGPFPYHPHHNEGYRNQPEGVDILTGQALSEQFPYLTTEAIGALHVRRAGWFSAQQLGSWMLDAAKQAGLRHLVDRVVDIETQNGTVVSVQLASGATIGCDVVINAAGPLAPDIGDLVGLDLPLKSEVHLKVSYRDHLGVIPRSAPMIIWSDTQRIEWSPEERLGLTDAGRTDLLGEMPVFCHGRPEGGEDSPYFLALWEYHDDTRTPEWPMPEDDLYPEVVIRGLSTMVPAMGRYLDGLPSSTVDGGYYTKTEENRPLIGPAGPEGFYLACGYSGFGVMVAAGGADLLARHLMTGTLPEYAPAFLLSRYEDPTYRASLSELASGQL